MIINFILAICVIVIVYLFAIIKKYKTINDNRDSFVATVTHDLKSPTRAQINILKMLLNGEFGNLNPKQQEILKLMSGSSNYISNLVGTILTDYEFSTHNLHLNFEEFNLVELINSICLNNEYLAKEKNQEIIFTHDKSYCKIIADKIQIERVISNLLNNAIVYGFKNSKIKINLTQFEQNINFSISNRSYTIEQKDLKNIFNKFAKCSNSKSNTTSNGLGLYVSKQIIDMHRGKIYASSSNDGLCKFGFTLPTKESRLKINKIKANIFS